MQMRGAALRAGRAAQRERASLWTAAALSRARKLPSFDVFVGPVEGPAVRRQSRAELQAMFDALVAPLKAPERSNRHGG